MNVVRKRTERGSGRNESDKRIDLTEKETKG